MSTIFVVTKANLCILAQDVLAAVDSILRCLVMFELHIAELVCVCT